MLIFYQFLEPVDSGFAEAFEKSALAKEFKSIYEW